MLTALQIFAVSQFVSAVATLALLFPVMNVELLIPRTIPNIRYLAFAVILTSCFSLLASQDYNNYNYLFIVNCFSWIIATAIITNHRRQFVLNWMNVIVECLFTTMLVLQANVSNVYGIFQLVFLVCRSICILIFLTILISRYRSKYYQHLKKLMPFLIPKGNRRIQIYILLSLMWLLSARVVNVMLPLQYKQIIDSLTGDKQQYVEFILIYTAINILQGGNGLISSLQSFCFIPVRQYISKSVGVATFNHLHNLSMAFHINRKTGEILRIMDRGTSSISNLMQAIIFMFVPIVIDIVVAITYFVIAFNAYFGLIIFVALFLYMLITIVITEWRVKLRRDMINADNKMNQIAVDSLLNFETVKLYSAEQYETDRYSNAVDSYNKADFATSASLNLLNASQNVIICGCTLTGALYAAYLVNHGQITVGDFVLFISYLQQLYGPLNYFGTLYRQIAQNLVDLEKMIELLDHEADVQDDPNATVLKIKGGSIKIQDCSFSYGNQVDVLKNISLEIPGGSSAALVGSSGSGKSTLMKLLFRFYDLSRGTITIDGQNILQVGQKSLRSRIGIVPQDPVLFNDTLMYNVRYSRPTATDQEVYEACKLAQIHDKILQFPDKYQTMVGERGLRLSGGEKQRIAIARTFLKNPSIIFFDVIYD